MTSPARVTQPATDPGPAGTSAPQVFALQPPSAIRWLHAPLGVAATLAAVVALPACLSRPLTPSRTLLGFLALLFLMSALPVFALRWLRPPTTALMMWRRLRRGRDDAPVVYEWVRYEAIAAPMRLAAIGAEDARFLSHAGFDWPSIRRAFRHNRRGGSRRGASTISQQVAKNLFLWSGRSYLRKAIEAYFTVLIEAAWTKRRILEIYLNIAQFGPSVFGVAAASRVFLSKEASGLSREEAALLAAVLPNPHRYQVRRPSPAVRLRQVLILESVRRLGDLDPDGI